MNAIEVYAILKKKIESAATGIVDIRKEDGYIIFEMDDGTEFRIEDSTKDIIDITVDANKYIVVTYEDGTSTTSDEPIPYPSQMTGATSSEDGTGGLVPAPTSGDVKYLNSRGVWDDSLPNQVAMLSSVVPTSGIPTGATLTEDGWVVTTEEEVAEEFAKWED